jgi:hypothetical protein
MLGVHTKLALSVMNAERCRSWLRLLPGFSLSPLSLRKRERRNRIADESKHGQREQDGAMLPLPRDYFLGGCFIDIRNLLWDPGDQGAMPSIPHLKNKSQRGVRKKIRRKKI